MVTIKAAHSNGYIKIALLRTEADAPSVIASLEAAGYWNAITVAAFEPRQKGRAR